MALPFLDSETNTKVLQALRQSVENIKISYKTNNSLHLHLVNSKDKQDHLSKSGIYKLNCNSCNSTYIGRTCRPLKVRIQEHLTKSTSVFGEHLKGCNHNFSPRSNSKILHSITSKNFNRLDFMEDIEIGRELQDNFSCLNTQVNLNRAYIPLHRRLLN